MEPVSVAGFVVTCVRLSTLLYIWIVETKTVDGTIKAFAAEVEALSFVLDAVKSSSQDTRIINALPRQHNNGLWAFVQKTLCDCSTIVGELDKLLAGIGSRSGVGHVITNFNLKLKSGKMTLLRQQIQSYTSVLQMSMQMINVHLSVHNNASNANSSAHLSTLSRSIERAEYSLNRHRAESMRASADGERELADDYLAFGRLEQCTRMAHEVVSSASSVIGEPARSRPG
ncbi:hypothetical protein V8E54_000853, partial [Elaphomyces granulatus]